MSARSDILTLGRVPRPLPAVSPEASSGGRGGRHMAIEPVRGAHTSSYTTQSVQLVPSGARSAQMAVTGAAPRRGSVPLVGEYGAGGRASGRASRGSGVGGRVADRTPRGATAGVGSRPARRRATVSAEQDASERNAAGSRPAHARTSVAGSRVAAHHAAAGAARPAADAAHPVAGAAYHAAADSARRTAVDPSRKALFVREAADESERPSRPRADERGRIAVRPAVSSEKAPHANPVAVAAGWAAAHRALAIALATAAVTIAMLYPPARAYYAAVRVNSVLSAQLSDVNASNDSLQSDVSSLMTKEGIEDEARRRGYVAKGDTAVDMSGVDDSGGATSDQASSAASASSDQAGASSGADSTASGSTVGSSSASEPWYLSVLDAFFGYDPSTQGVG